MRDIFIEIWESLKRNKLRTCLTGFAVVWGIFMLIVLLGAGNGLMNAFLMDSSGISVNSMNVGGNVTSKPYAGYKQGRRIKLEESDVELLKSETFADIIDGVTPASSQYLSLNNGKLYSSCQVMGISPEYRDIQKIELLYGRFLNDNDLGDKRKIIVIPSSTAENLSEIPENYPELLGKSLKLGQSSFKVVGIYKADASSYNANAYIPISTYKAIWSPDQYIDEIYFNFHGLETMEANEEFEKNIKEVMNLNHNAAPDDNSAIWIWNQFTMNLQMNTALGLLRTGLWIIGLLTLLSGIVGVSNIMLITVKERTHEFGIRKALGAKPWDITKLIITESVCITAFFGYIGMVLGMLACELLDLIYGRNPVTIMEESIQVFKNPGIGVDVAIEATILLIVAGTIAGLIPAMKATKVRPIEALRAD